MTRARAPRRHTGIQPFGSNRLRALLALLATTTSWGTSFIAAKSVMEDIPPISLAFLRFAIALVVLIPLFRRQGERPAWGLDAVFLGFSGVAVLFVFQNFGINLAGAADAALIMSGGYPVITAVLAWKVLGERLHRRGLIGLVASVVGVALVFLVAANTVGGSLLGDVLLLISAASCAAYVVFGRRAFTQHGLLAMLTGSAGWGVVMLAPFALVEAVTSDVRLPSLPDALVMVYLSVGCSGLAYLLWGYSLRYLTATEAAIIGNLEVVIGLAAASVVLGEPVVAMQVGGGVLVLTGAWLASIPDPEKSRVGYPRRLLSWRPVFRTRGDAT